MDILYLLVPLSAVLILAILGVFAWALQAGQFDDLTHEGERILHNDSPAAPQTGSRRDVGSYASRRADANHPNESDR